MNNLKKLISPFALYWHFSLDTVLTHVFVIAFLMAGFPAIAAFLMSVDALFKVIFSVFMSRLALSIPSAARGKVSAVLRLSLIILWFISVAKIPIDKVAIDIFIPYVLFKILLLFDSFVSAEFIFGLKKYFYSDLSQSATAQNILIRASVSIAPALALIMIETAHASLTIFIISIAICLLSILFLKNVFFNDNDNKIAVPNKPLGFNALMNNPYMRWGFIYQIVGNLAFAGVSFILLKELKPHGDLFMNEITMLYFAFLMVQIIVLVFGEDIIPISKISQIALNMAVCAVAVIFAALCHQELWRLTVCFIIGLTYSLTLSGMQKVVTTKLRGPGYIEYVGWA
ncbi:MAG: hypothetical protein P4M14_10630 [Gammaproteobacteria bacterium]|nr:hypothetical protein [Gammaproteobacteria bacterium]